MAQVLLNETTPNGGDLDANFAELYGVANYFRTPVYTGTLWKVNIDSTGRVGVGPSVTPAYSMDVQTASGTALRAKGTGATGAGAIEVHGSGDTGVQILSYGASYASASILSVGASGSAIVGTSAGPLAFTTGVGLSQPLIFGVANTEGYRLDTSRNLLVGRSAQAGGGKLEVAGNIVLQPASGAPTLTVNGDMTFRLASNTSLQIYVRGSDGFTRSATLTLA